MHFPWQREENRNLQFGDAVAAAVAQIAAGETALPTGPTAAMEIAAGWWARGFASASVTPADSAIAKALTADIRADIGRALCMRGESVYLLDGDGGLRLRRVTAWTVSGGPERADWEYICTLAGPTSQMTLTAPATRVFHAMYSQDLQSPWRGRGPLENSSRQLAMNLEARLAEETGGGVGSVIPIPATTNKTLLQTDLRGLKGRLGLVDSTAGSWDAGSANAPSGEWMPRRLGANPPPTLPTLRSDVERSILAECGIPPEAVTGGQGTASREAFRRFLHLTITPIADVVSAQLEELTGEVVAFSFDRLFASDIQGRARAFQSMVGGGMDVAKAAQLSGLLAVEDD